MIQRSGGADGGPGQDTATQHDFFVSYTSVDHEWAEWVAWTLEEAGYRVLVQAWDFVPGSNWAVGMQHGVEGARRTIALVSSAYLLSVFGQAEWQAAAAQDPLGFGRKLVPVRIEPCDRPGLLGQIVSFDLFGLTSDTARQTLLEQIANVAAGRSKPAIAPRFPGDEPLTSTSAAGRSERGTGTSSLAGRVLGALVRRRRSRSRSLDSSTMRTSRVIDGITVNRSLATGEVGVLGTIDAVSRALGSVAGIQHLPVVIAIEAARSGPVTVYFAEPCDPQPPFTVGNGPHVWDLSPDRVDYWRNRETAVSVLRTLITVGQTDQSDWVFLDLEGVGAVEVLGDPGSAAELARSMVADLFSWRATDPLTDVTVVGMAELPASLTHVGVGRVDSLDHDLVDRVERRSDAMAGQLRRHGLPGTLSGRARGIVDTSPLVIVLASSDREPVDSVLLERVVKVTTPGGCGVAVVAIGALGTGATRVIVGSDGRITIPRLGLRVNAARPPGFDLDEVVELAAGAADDSATEVSRQHPSLKRPADVSAPRVATPYEAPSWRYCVRIFADHLVQTPEGQTISFRYGDNPDVPNKNTHRGPELLGYLALSGRAANATDVRDHLWWDRPVALTTVNKLLYGTRKVLGGADLLSLAQDDPVGRYRLSPEVVTDVELLSHALEHAHAVAAREPDEVIKSLRVHLDGIEAVAFRNGYLGHGVVEWAAAYRVIDRVEQPVVDAALLVAKLCTQAGPYGFEEALWAVDQGLTACPINEVLVRAAMQIEARMGSTEAVNNRYLTLATTLARDELEPDTETSDLLRRLTGRT